MSKCVTRILGSKLLLMSGAAQPSELAVKTQKNAQGSYVSCLPVACRDLSALFEELVRQSGSISEQEFWAGRQHLLRKQQGESGPQRQRAGMGNAMLLAMRPSADGKTNTVRTLL